MGTSPSPRKEKNGFRRLWTKLRLATRPKPRRKFKTVTAGTMDAPPPDSQLKQSMPSTQPEPSTQPPAVLPMPTTTTADTHSTHTSSIPVKEPLRVQHPTEPSLSSTTDAPTKPTIETATATGPAVSHDEKEGHSRRYERTQAIFRKYNVEFDETSWDTNPKLTGERVYRSPRIRVRWTCHECKTTFGSDKICVECAHPRCRTCPRYPPKKSKAKAAKIAAHANTMSEPSKEEVQEGACHECQTTFEIGSEECSNCHHRICDRCLQEFLSSVAHVESQSATV